MGLTAFNRLRREAASQASTEFPIISTTAISEPLVQLTTVDLEPVESAESSPLEDRIFELIGIEAEKGWDAIKAIAESFDPPVQKADTWKATIPAIAQRELDEGLL